MKKIERHSRIKQEINKKGQVSVIALAKLFDVAQETIRRDLLELEQQRVLHKVHGGATDSLIHVEQPLSDRFEKNKEEKDKIAKKARGLIQDKMRLFIDFGSTTLAFVYQLIDLNYLTIYTNSPLIATTIGTQNRTHKIYLLGGLYYPELRENLGSITVNLIDTLFVDLAVVGVSAIDLDRGFMASNEEESNVARHMLLNSEIKVILADPSKFYKKGAFRVAEFSEIDYLITSEHSHNGVLSVCQKYNINHL